MQLSSFIPTASLRDSLSPTEDGMSSFHVKFKLISIAGRRKNKWGHPLSYQQCSLIIWGRSTYNFCFLTSPNMDSDEIPGQDLLKPEKEEELDEK